MPNFDYEVLLIGGTRLRVTQPFAMGMMKDIGMGQTGQVTVSVLDEDGIQKAAVLSIQAIVGIVATEEALTANGARKSG